MSHFVTPVAVAATAALAVPSALVRGIVRAPRFVAILIVDDPTVADEASLQHIAYQLQTDGSDLWRGYGDPPRLSVALPNLARGEDTVTWHVASAGTREAQGRFDVIVVS
jgi:hypothetical protein